jgi:hypothetical protein
MSLANRSDPQPELTSGSPQLSVKVGGDNFSMVVVPRFGFLFILLAGDNVGTMSQAPSHLSGSGQGN